MGYGMMDGGIAGMMAFMGAFFVFFLLVALAVYIYSALALMTIAKKTKTENAWFAWIPILNIYLLTQVAGVSGWITAAFLLAIIPFIGGLIVAALTVWLWWKVAERLKLPEWYGILMIIPIVNLIMMGIMAWGKK